MRTLARQREERPLQMRAEDIGALIHLGSHITQILALHVDRIRDQRTHLTGRAMHRMPGARHIDAIRAVVKAFLPRAVRMDVHVSGGHDLARGIDDRIRSDAIRTAGGLEIVIRRASRRDRAIGVGHDPSMFLDAAGATLRASRIAKADGAPSIESVTCATICCLSISQALFKSYPSWDLVH